MYLTTGMWKLNICVVARIIVIQYVIDLGYSYVNFDRIGPWVNSAGMVDKEK